MKDCREEWYDETNKVAVTVVDVTEAAQTLAKGHLSGPTATHYLAEALAAAALLGAETSEPDETVIVQMKCKGPLGGFNVECTSAGTLRGYTEKKILDDFDGAGKPNDRKVIGEAQYQVTRSVPGRIISQGISSSLDGYLAGSLQRKACIRVEAVVSDEVEVIEARGVMVEDMPDATGELRCCRLADLKNIATAPRTLLRQLGLERATLKKTTPLKFACRCSAERAKAMVDALDGNDGGANREKTTVTCHLCGKSYEV